jgi:hypothetical protein
MDGIQIMCGVIPLLEQSFPPDPSDRFAKTQRGAMTLSADRTSLA